MKRLCLLLTLITLLLPRVATAAPLSQEQAWHQHLSSAQAEARASGKTMLVDLYADWCGWCKRLDRDVFSQDRFRDYAQRFVLLRVNVDDGAEGTELQTRFSALSLPTTLLLSPELVEVGRIDGYAPVAGYIARLDAVQERFRQDEERRAVLRRSGNPVQLLALARELHGIGDGLGAAELYRQLLADGAKVELTPAWITYLLADALLLGGRPEPALEELGHSREQAVATGNPELLEACDLLRIRIARERGDCRETRAALESFITDHPYSSHRTQARSTLRALDAGKVGCT